jgi:hypothetical protein
MHKKAHYLIAAAGLMGVAFPVSAEPPNVVYEFQVLTESLRNCLNNNIVLNPHNDCTVTPGHAPYMLATLTLTHRAFAKRRAQWASGSDAPGAPPDEKPVDDQGVVSWGMDGYPWIIPNNSNAGLYDLRLPPPPNPNGYNFPLYFELDLNIVGGEIGGQVEMAYLQAHADGCELTMTGTDGHWSGTWVCETGGGGVQHAFTAIATRVNGHVAQK